MLARKIALCLSLIGSVAFAGCSGSPQTAVRAASPPAAPVQEAPAPRPSPYITSGPLVVENQVDVAAQREGVVARIVTDVGMQVRKGQLLGSLDDRQLTAELQAAHANVKKIQFNLKNWEADLDVLRVDLERAQKMWDAQLITHEQLEHDKYKVVADEFQVQRERQALLQAEATARSLEIELDKTHIRAPFDGVVARRYVRDGQKVAVGDRLFWVTAIGPLTVKFTLSQELLEKTKIGNEVGVSSPFLSGQEHTARITQVSPVVDPASGTIEVQARLLGPPGDLRPGMTVNVRIKDQ